MPSRRSAASAADRSSPGIPVGTVDHGATRASAGSPPTGTIDPAVDTTTLDVVAVVLTAGRARTARPVVTGTG